MKHNSILAQIFRKVEANTPQKQFVKKIDFKKQEKEWRLNQLSFNLNLLRKKKGNFQWEKITLKDGRIMEVEKLIPGAVALIDNVPLPQGTKLEMVDGSIVYIGHNGIIGFIQPPKSKVQAPKQHVVVKPVTQSVKTR